MLGDGQLQAGGGFVGNRFACNAEKYNALNLATDFSVKDKATTSCGQHKSKSSKLYVASGDENVDGKQPIGKLLGILFMNL